MANEQHCRSCGAVDQYEYRLRCDGCGGLIDREREMAVTTVIVGAGHEHRQNARVYCEACAGAVLALPTWNCKGCGHPRHMHNGGCMVTFARDPKTGMTPVCSCGGFVE